MAKSEGRRLHEALEESLFPGDTVPLLLNILFGFVFVCFAELRLLDLLNGGRLGEQSSVAESVLSGHATWRAYQNRLLGPFLVKSIAWAGGTSYDAAYDAFIQDAVILANALCLMLVRRLTRSSIRGLMGMVAFAALFVALQGGGPIYAWDFVDLFVMLGFAYAIVNRATSPTFVALFAVELLNRETAELIAVWMLAASIDYRPNVQPLSRERIHWRRGGIGAALLFAGFVWTWFIRQRLFISSMHAAIGADATHEGLGQHWKLVVNLQRLVHYPGVTVAVAIGVLWLFVITIVRCLRRLDRNTAVPLAILGSAMAVSVLCFGVIDELRVYVSFVPFVVVLSAANAAPAPAPPTA